MKPAAVITTSIEQSLKELDLPQVSVELEHPANRDFGDYSTNAALTIFGQLDQDQQQRLAVSNPRQLAEKIAGQIDILLQRSHSDLAAEISVAGPGFINFTLSEKFLLQELKQLAAGTISLPQTGSGQTVVIDYSAPNIAKRFSIGHLRSTIIGQAIYNLYQALDWEAIGDNHLGDWGTQFGKMIVAIRSWADKDVDQLTIPEMEQLYVRFHQEAEQNPTLNDQARQAFKDLEQGKAEETKLWQQLVEQSMQEFDQIYQLLDVEIDYAYGESFYQDIMPDVIALAKEKGLAEESEGALIFPYSEEDLPPAMLQKKDGATTYFTRDLATIKFRKDQWHPELVVYEVGAEQKLHFRQVFLAAEMLGLIAKEKLVHIPHGLISLKQGKMSTRQGNVVKLEQVLSQAIKKAKKFNPDPDLAKIVGIGAVKYNDLKRAPERSYTFDWEEMLSLEGNSGPYLQYTHARCQSLLEKSPVSYEKFGVEQQLSADYQLNQEELNILRNLYQAPEIIEKAAEEFAPHHLCTYLHQLAQTYNSFYNKHPILDSPEDRQLLRLALTKAVAVTLDYYLGLLGITAPDQM